MKKLRMNPEDLRVDSFEVAAGVGTARGTVHGNATLWCTRAASCYGSCPGTCEDSCNSCPIIGSTCL